MQASIALLFPALPVKKNTRYKQCAHQHDETITGKTNKNTSKNKTLFFVAKVMYLATHSIYVIGTRKNLLVKNFTTKRYKSNVCKYRTMPCTERAIRRC